MGLLDRPKVIHEKPRPAGVTVVGGAAAALGLLVLLPALLALLPRLLGGEGLPRESSLLLPLLSPPAAGLLLLAAGVGLLRRSEWALRLALGLALAGAAGSGAALWMGLPLPLLEARSFWGWLLGLWYCLLAFFYLRQKRVVESF